ncbi:hypothetical protein EJB05_14901, partial [Eragrostis curvula]
MQKGHRDLITRATPAKAYRRGIGMRKLTEVYPAQTRFFTGRGDVKAAALAELLAHLLRLEGVLGDKAFFGGNEFGFLDVAFVPFSAMF